MYFSCYHQWENEKKEAWTGKVAQIYPYGSHYEIFLHSRSSIRVLVGKTCSGFFACVPDFRAGCHLSSLDDLFYNREKVLAAIDNVIDASTVAFALKHLATTLKF
ncbi:MAG: hypothetical protein ACOX6E_09325 [Syntrophomonadaceae bacterium]|jgi:hypothetical protein